MNQKDRLLKALNGQKVDRPPVICPGGMMNAAVTEVVENISKNHNVDVDSMVEAAKKVYEITGFENYGVPFCMTVEAEPLGVELDFGSKIVEPRVTEYNKNQLEYIMKNYKVNPLKDKRMPAVIEAVKRLKNDDIPVTGSITGAISTATSVVDPLGLIKMFRKSPKEAYEFIDYVNDYTIEYAVELVKAGADVIAVADPTATGEILGKRNFDKFASPMYKKLIKEMHKFNVPVIIHICGNTKNIIESLNEIGADAVSFDSIVNMRLAKSKLKTRLMGNINTQLLHTGTKKKIISITKNCIDSGVDIVSPACGLSMATPIENLKAMTDFVKGKESL
ncbi:uroporphyrinogen decarboxylase family protein [Haloimpatiens sp. FM7330]|uniref:uroporphyrinogen decarboxylase family protein n=1 Tax=Haloimpatiens sp. FM7330 TaxID=3298610 RepID=UPI00362C5FB6